MHWLSITRYIKTCCPIKALLYYYSALYPGDSRFQFSIDIFDYVPGGHSVLVRVIDQINRFAADSISFTTPPLPSITCDVNNNILTCNSNNPIATQVCEFDGDPPTPCTSPLNVLELGLPLGLHSVKITITDVFLRSLNVPVVFSVKSNLQLTCSEVEDERVLIGGVDCRSDGGIGEVSYSCSYDAGQTENCE